MPTATSTSILAIRPPASRLGPGARRRSCDCRPRHSPCSPKYQGSQTKYDNSDFFNFTSAKVTDNRVLFGLKLHLGERTLQQTDRTGATLDIVSPLANPTSPLMFVPPIVF